MQVQEQQLQRGSALQRAVRTAVLQSSCSCFCRASRHPSVVTFIIELPLTRRCHPNIVQTYETRCTQLTEAFVQSIVAVSGGAGVSLCFFVGYLGEQRETLPCTFLCGSVPHDTHARRGRKGAVVRRACDSGSIDQA